MSLPEPQGRAVTAPVTHVTLLEDRARVVRTGTVNLDAGTHRLSIVDVAPVLQNVSLRVSASGGSKVVDARARRTNRVHKEEKPELARELQARVEALSKEHQRRAEDLELTQARLDRLEGIIREGLGELPQDASWGLVQQGAWRETFEQLFVKARALRAKLVEDRFREEEVSRQLSNAVSQRQALDRVDSRFVAWLELEVVVPKSGDVQLTCEYTVPNALWRPLHSAQLAGTRVTWSCSAVVWQNTGEDWTDAQLSFSTARSSLGTEPPLLSDDLLAAKKKAEQVVVAMREVAVQRASVGGGGLPPPSGVQLPGVDDGGEVRNLKALSKQTVPSDGRPNVVPLFSFEDEAQVARVVMPELAATVFVKATFRNLAAYPLLAGPVELLRDHGAVGWTTTLFAAPKEPLQLSFGPDDALRVVRADRQNQESHQVTKWVSDIQRITLFLSNLGEDDREVEITERVPVSEIEHVKIALLDTKGYEQPAPDSNGLCTWKVTLPGNSQKEQRFGFSVSRAPGVQLG